MPFKSKKQEKYLKKNKPSIYKDWKMNYQGQKDKEDERLGEEVGVLKRKVKATRKASTKHPWRAHVAKVKKTNKSMTLKDLLKHAKTTYKKKGVGGKGKST